MLPTAGRVRDEAAVFEAKPVSGDEITWTRRERRILVSACIIVGGVVSGTYVSLSLLAAFEQDGQLEWTPQATTHITVVASTAEVVGLLCIGPFADYAPSYNLMIFTSWVVCVGMVITITSNSIWTITSTAGVVCASKALLWPSFGALISANLPVEKHDVCFLLAACASRSGNLLASLLLGGTMTFLHWSWRGSLLALLTLLALLLLFGAAVMPTELAVPLDPHLSLTGLAQKCVSLAKCSNGWLALITCLGTSACWGLATYLPVLAQDKYGLDAGRATGIEATFTSGSLLGVIIGSTISGCAGFFIGRVTQGFQVAMGIVALLWLAYYPVSLVYACALWMVVGFGFVVASYVPYLAYAASGPSAERAFRLAVIDGLSQTYGIFLAHLFGSLREKHGAAAFAPLHYISGASLTVAFVSMTTLYRRLGCPAPNE